MNEYMVGDRVALTDKVLRDVDDLEPGMVGTIVDIANYGPWPYKVVLDHATKCFNKGFVLHLNNGEITPYKEESAPPKKKSKFILKKFYNTVRDTSEYEVQEWSDVFNNYVTVYNNNSFSDVLRTYERVCRYGDVKIVETLYESEETVD